MNIAYIDMDYILKNVPEYQQASGQLENKVQTWRSEINEKQNKIDQLKQELENERPLLTKELIEEREDDITYLQDQLLDYQQKRFGPDGDYIIQKKQLVRPVQDQVYNAVEEIAENRKIDIIFDRTSEIGMVYAKSNFDVSEQVLRIIKRTANRKQIEERKDLIELRKEENRTAEQDKVIDERYQRADSLKTERQLYIEERRRKIDSVREARKAEFEVRRARILEERQQRKDSINAARNNQ
ncbi:OmpH family outer membrane protein [Zunongwangia sp.]|uniref:OmpH family outer membrane protein n=1 Tax=Zunongwangia sp. TaxID=1965325 RepID=UPI003AA81378